MGGRLSRPQFVEISLLIHLIASLICCTLLHMGCNIIRAEGHCQARERGPLRNRTVTEAQAVTQVFTWNP